jgi:hypothetical protein
MVALLNPHTVRLKKIDEVTSVTDWTRCNASAFAARTGYCRR